MDFERKGFRVNDLIPLSDLELPLTESAVDLGRLYRLAATFGCPRLYLCEIVEGKHGATIYRSLGHSELKTKTHFEATPEAALTAAIKEASQWGLPLLRVHF